MAVTLAQAKEHLNIDEADTTDDDEVAFWLSVADAWVAKVVPAADLDEPPVLGAVRHLLGHLWESQRGPAGGTTDEDGFSLGLLGFAIPTRVKELLGPYLTETVPAAPAGSFPDAADWPDPVCW